jgi:hypothetical protein
MRREPGGRRLEGRFRRVFFHVDSDRYSCGGCRIQNLRIRTCLQRMSLVLGFRFSRGLKLAGMPVVVFSRGKWFFDGEFEVVILYTQGG